MAFSLFDKDRDGFISQDEVRRVMVAMGSSEAALKRLPNTFKEVDLDGNGKIDFHEFVHMMETRMERGPAEAEMKAMFAAFDKDHSGFIDAQELKTTMEELGMRLSLAEVGVMLREAGIQIDGRIYYEDFVKMMTGDIGQAQKRVSRMELPETEITSQVLNQIAAEAPPVSSRDDPKSRELQLAFSMFDASGDGAISSSKISSVMGRLGMHIDEGEVMRMVQKVDADGNGTIDFAEFRVLMSRYENFLLFKKRIPDASDAPDSAEMRQTFRIFDKDNDGLVSADDLRSTMGELGMALTQEDMAAMMRQAGVGPQGKIYFKDFCKIMYGHVIKPLPEIKGKFSEAQLKELRVVFAMFDKDRDGYISPGEVYSVLKTLGQTADKDKVDELVHQVDLDGNGVIDFKEFLLLVRRRVELRRSAVTEDAELRAMFKAFDKDNSGYVDADELRSTMGELGMPLRARDVRAMLKEAGIDHGRIYYEDFVQIMTGSIGKQQKRASALLHDDVPPPASKAAAGAAKEETAEPLFAPPLAPLAEAEDDDRDRDNRELRVAFALFDRDGDGSISSKELLAVLCSLGVDTSTRETQGILRKVDIDHNGKVDFAEFERMMRQHKHQCVTFQNHLTAEEEEMRKAFKVFDKNTDGYIDMEELRTSMKDLGITLSEKDARAMMKQAGCKILDRIYYEEFVRLMLTQVFKPLPKSGLLSDEHVQELRVAFALFDQDADGAVTQKELMSVLRSLALDFDDELVKKMIRTFDEDGNGTLEFGEFLAMMGKTNKEGKTRWESLKEKDVAPNTWKAFKIFDRNSNGFITRGELGLTMHELGVDLSNEDLDLMMKEADTNNDGKIDYKEFKVLMQGALAELAEKAAQLQDKKTSMFEATFAKDLSTEDIQQVFNSLDKEGKGVIEAGDIGVAMDSLGIEHTPRQLLDIMGKFSVKGNGKVDFNEFLKMMLRSISNRRKSNAAAKEEEEMRQAFKVFDIDGNGLIDAHELRLTMRNLGENLSEEDVKAMIGAADRNGDGKIDYEEFIRMMYSK